ncbi:MAG: replication initiator protein A [Acidobacteriota bacterium]
MNALPQHQELASRRESYRDELNFAEFPLASLSTSLPKDQKTLEFTDEIFDKSVNKRVQRKLTITASDKYGLPTAMDDEVILGLIQLTGRSDFKDRRVFFTRYELLKLLNWPDTTRNYHRLEQSLNRWLGVTLYYEKAWWSKEEQSWVSEGFHILDHVQILDQERQRRSAKRNADEAGKSSFVWNDIVFNSFKAGYIKQIDFEFYKGLESAVSKRLYRFLDKRFYQRQRLEFDLRPFCCDHIGLSKNYHNGELKRVLTPAIQELEALGYIETTSSEGRFLRKARGEWSVVFVKASKTTARLAEASPVVQSLVDRGLSAASARRIVATISVEKVQEKVALCDWLSARNDARVQKNKAGFLYRSITDDFALPEDYQAAVRAKLKRETSKVVPLTRSTPQQERPGADTDRAAIDAFWNSMPTDEQERIEQDLVESAPTFLRQHYIEGRKERGLLFQTVRQSMIDTYVRKQLHPS